MVSVAEVLTAGYFDEGRRSLWAPHLRDEFDRPYMRRLRGYLADEESKYGIFPKPKSIFEALDETTPSEVKVVILGQDPYPEPGQAHGLAFSTLSRKRPQSLSKIFAEVKRNVGESVPKGHNCLTPWARQGVLLLNRALTVRIDEAGEHLGKGWECFTDKVVETISKNCEHVVFLLWGEPAQQVGYLIDSKRHKILCSEHPSSRRSRRSRRQRLKGSKHFSQTNKYLEAHGAEPINWLDVCQRPPPHEQDVVAALTTADADDEAKWDRAFANSTTKLEQLAAEAKRERNAGPTEEQDLSQL